MAIMRVSGTDPFTEVNRLRGQLRKLLDDAFMAGGVTAGAAGQWTPAADIVADADRVIVTLEVCGVPREDLEVILEGTVLTVSGRRERCGRTGGSPVIAGVSSGQDRRAACPTEERLLLGERPVGEFSRSFSLAWPPSSHVAKLADGILTIALER